MIPTAGSSPDDANNPPVRRWFIAASLLALTAAASPAADPASAKTLRKGQKRINPQIWEALLPLTPIRVTQPGQLVGMVVFFDPNCPWCAQLWRNHYGGNVASPIATAWIPFAYFKDSSAGRALAIVRAPDPAAALARNFSNYDEAGHNGAIAPAEQATITARRLSSRWEVGPAQRQFGLRSCA